jgi:hypothetical protein
MMENNRALSVQERRRRGVFRWRDYGPKEAPEIVCRTSIFRLSKSRRASPRNYRRPSTGTVDNFVGNLGQSRAKARTCELSDSLLKF